MMKKILALMLVLVATGASALAVLGEGKKVNPPKPPPGWKVGQPVVTPPVFVPPNTGGTVTFTPLHTFFMSPSGSDTNTGLSPAQAWQTPNHNVVCGDVILAGPGDYTSIGGFGSFGTVSNCPSTSGGIDGTGGIYFATILCAGVDLEACFMLNATNVAFDISVNNWSVQGWKISYPSICPGASCGLGQRAFQLDGTSAPVAYFAMINNICVSVGSCVHSDDLGMANTSRGADYFAGVGNIGVQASGNVGNCEAAFDAVGVFPHDSNAGTHVYFYNNITWNNNAGTGCDPLDSESFMFDTWGAHLYNNTGVVSNNISWNSKRFCIHVIGPGPDTVTPTIKWYNNTCYNNLVAITSFDTADGEFNILLGAPWTIQISRNIAQNTRAQSGGGGTTCTAGSNCINYAFLTGGGLNSNVTYGTGADQNIFKGAATVCAGATCEGGITTCSPTCSITEYNSNTLPSGIIADPGFNNVTDLINNRSANTISCSGFINTTQCMGWNANTQVLTNPSVIYDLQPNPNCGSVANQCVGKGFQLPSTTCASTGPLATDYPTWLKGMVYLHASGYVLGATITQNPDLATRKCGL